MILVASWNIVVNKCGDVDVVPKHSLDMICWYKKMATKLYSICSMYQPVWRKVFKSQ